MFRTAGMGGCAPGFSPGRPLQATREHSAKRINRERATAFIDKLKFLKVNSFIFAGVFWTEAELQVVFMRFSARSSAIEAAHPSNMKKLVVMGMLKRIPIAAKVIVCRS